MKKSYPFLAGPVFSHISKKYKIFFAIIFFIAGPYSLFAATYYTRGPGGNWSSTATWSTASCNGAAATGIPGANDNVIICQSNGGGTVSVTIDGNFSCKNLTIGNGNANATIQITVAGNSLDIGGDLQINSSNANRTYVLDAGPGIININGTFSTWNTNGVDNIQVSTGTVTIAPAVVLSGGGQSIIFNDAGVINFNSAFNCSVNQANFVTFSGCTVNFGGSYTQSASNITFDPASYENFTGSPVNITPNRNILFGNVFIGNNADVTLVSSTGQTEAQGNFEIGASAAFTANAWTGCGGFNVYRCFYVLGDVTLDAASVFNLNENMQIRGSWINNGGTLNGGSNAVTFESIGNFIGGTTSTAFPDLIIGNTLNNVTITLSQNISCANFTLDSDNSARVFSFDGTNPVMTVNGDVTINQPQNNNTNSWNINGGSAVVSGNLIFSGTSNTTTRIAQIDITSGTFTLNGNISWMTGQPVPQEVVTEIINLSGSGVINFSNSVSMAQGSGTFNITGNGTVNFMGSSAPCYSLNQTVAGNTVNAVLNTSYGCTLNFNNGFTNANAGVTLADGSYSVFTGSGTVTPNAAIIFGNVQINAGKTMTLAGNISLTDNWTNAGGTFAPGTNTVTFSGTASQTITNATGESFYILTCNTAGPVILANNVTVTNALNMAGGNINLNNFTLTLGNSAAATLNRTTGIAYGGTFKRWFPVAVISSTVSPFYGLFPVGSSADYRPVSVNSAVNPATAGYVLVSHSDALGVTDVVYNDNEGTGIQRIHNIKSAVSTLGITGGTYNIDVAFSSLATTGVLTDLKLETYTGGVMGSAGTSAATTGIVSAPTVKRTGLSTSDLSNVWVIGSKNVNPSTGTPLRQYYYSRRSGNWTDNTAGNATWSYISGGTGASCDCKPSSDGYVVISSGNVVFVDANSACDYIDISASAVLNGSSNLTVNYDLTANGNGVFSPSTGLWTVSRDVTLNGPGSSSTPNSAMTINGNINIASTASLTLNSGLTISGNVVIDGNLTTQSNTVTLNGSGKTISGLGSILSATGSINVPNDKTILSGTDLTIAPVFAISGSTTIINKGTINATGNLTGTISGSTWTNAAGSVLNVAAGLLSTGTLNASASPNEINYNGSGAQSIKKPSGSYYNLTVSNSGTKTYLTAAAITVSNMLTIQNAAIFDAGTNTLNGTGGLTMSGTTELKIATNVTAFPGLPSLNGTYNLTGGTITLNNGGNQAIRSLNSYPGAFYNLNLAGSGTKTLMGPITVRNDFTIAGTARADVTGTNYDLTVGGNWTVTSTNAGPFNERNGTVTFNGSGSQTLSTVLANGETFYNLTVNKTTGTLFLGSNAAITDILTLTSGPLNLNAKTLTLSNSSGTAVARTSGYVISEQTNNSGKIKWAIGNTTGSHTFPFGTTGGIYIPFIFNLTTGTIGNVTVSTYPTAADNTPYPITPVAVTHINNTSGTDNSANTVDRFWQIDKDGVSGTAAMTFNATAAEVGSITTLQAQRWNSAQTGWDVPIAGQTNTATSATVSGVTTFSPWTLSGNNSPLPIELLYFNATECDRLVCLDWSTATELNNKFFTVERSKDGNVFEGVCQVPGKGTTNVQHWYNTVDSNPYTGDSYYRLKQTDFNGAFQYSGIKMVSIEYRSTLIYPNPSSTQQSITLQINETVKQGSKMNLYDIEGKFLKSYNIFLSVTSFDMNLPAGIYYAEVINGNQVLRQKLIIE